MIDAYWLEESSQTKLDRHRINRINSSVALPIEITPQLKNH